MLLLLQSCTSIHCWCLQHNVSIPVTALLQVQVTTYLLCFACCSSGRHHLLLPQVLQDAPVASAAGLMQLHQLRCYLHASAKGRQAAWLCQRQTGCIRACANRVYTRAAYSHPTPLHSDRHAAACLRGAASHLHSAAVVCFCGELLNHALVQLPLQVVGIVLCRPITNVSGAVRAGRCSANRMPAPMLHCWAWWCLTGRCQSPR
jgi:hypothetical protein